MYILNGWVCERTKTYEEWEVETDPASIKHTGLFGFLFWVFL